MLNNLKRKLFDKINSIEETYKLNDDLFTINEKIY
jgi:hypothetical protein